MLEIQIPGFGNLDLESLVCDYNGTLARSGRLAPEVRAMMLSIAAQLRIYVITGDSFGTATEQLRGLPCEIKTLPSQGQAKAKQEFVAELGSRHVVAIGNGRNDRLMLAEAILGIAVVGDEGVASQTAAASDVLVKHIADAFALLREPRRLVATLRS